MPLELSNRSLKLAEWIVRNGHGWRPYAMAIIAVLIATGIRLAVSEAMGPRLAFTSYSPAIAVAAVLGGLLPGMLALLLSMMMAWFLFLPPAFSFFLTETDALQLVYYVVVEVPLIVFAWLLHKAIHLLVDQRQQIEQALERERRQQRLVVGELEHRIGNLFGLTEIIATKTFLPSLEDKQTFHERMSALRIASRATTGSLTIVTLLDQQLAPFRQQVEVGPCPELPLSPSAAQQLCLIVHELITNAAKYGALSTSVGRVAITCSITRAKDDDVFDFEWKERDGPAMCSPELFGFGTEVLRKAPEFAGAKVDVDYAPDGLRYNYSQRVSRLRARP